MTIHECSARQENLIPIGPNEWLLRQMIGLQTCKTVLKGEGQGSPSSIINLRKVSPLSCCIGQRFVSFGTLYLTNPTPAFSSRQDNRTPCCLSHVKEKISPHFCMSTSHISGLSFCLGKGNKAASKGLSREQLGRQYKPELLALYSATAAYSNYFQ